MRFTETRLKGTYIIEIEPMEVDNTGTFYQMSEFYHPESAKGARWDDPAFGIEWPSGNKIISGKDKIGPVFIYGQTF